MNLGQFLNGLAGPVAMAVPPVLSILWFPVQQRTSTTALAAFPNGVGVALSFLTGRIAFLSGRLTLVSS